MLDDLATLLLRGLHFFFGRIQSLVLPGFSREEDQALTVGFEARDVQRDGFGGKVRAAGVDGDADCGSEFAGDTGFLYIKYRRLDLLMTVGVRAAEEEVEE